MLPARADEGAPHRQRMAGWIKPPPGVDPLDAVYCPNGHHILRRRLLQFHESGTIVCEYREPPRGRERCDAQLLVLKVLRPAQGNDGRQISKLYVAEVDWREMLYLATAPEGRDVYAMLEWLGCHYMPAVAPSAVRLRRER